MDKKNHYKVWREMDLDYDRIPVCASKGKSVDMINMLEPYLYEDMREFSAVSQSEYETQEYDYTEEELLPYLTSRVHGFMDEYAKNSMKYYKRIVITSRDYHVIKKKADAVLLPIWMIKYDYRNREYVFMMNGETGKIAGTLPVSKAKLAAWFLGTTGLLFAVVRLVTEFVFGGGIG